MRRLSTIKNDLQNAMADLEMLASALEDKPGMVPGRAQQISNLMSAAGGIAQVLARLS